MGCVDEDGREVDDQVDEEVESAAVFEGDGEGREEEREDDEGEGGHGGAGFKLRVSRAPGIICYSFLMIKPPPAIQPVLDTFDKKSEGSKLSQIQDALHKALAKEDVEDEFRAGWWAERAAFLFTLPPQRGETPWGTAYGPFLVEEAEDGTRFYSPDIKDATAETIEYWQHRAEQTGNPSMSSRYADLVWDLCEAVSQRKPSHKMAEMAIDGYLESLRSHDHDHRRSIHSSLDRSIFLSMSIADKTRTRQAIEAATEYALDNPSVGNFCFLLDTVLLDKSRREHLDTGDDVFGHVLKFFRTHSAPGEHDVSPHGTESLGKLIAKYYRQKNETTSEREIYLAIASAFERRAKVGDAFSGLHFRQEAKKYYLLGNDRDAANRMDKEASDLAGDAKAEMRQITHEFTIPKEDVDKFQAYLTEDDLDTSLIKWVNYFIPRQDAIKEQKKNLDKEFPLQALLGSTIVGDQGLVAQVDDTRGDPEGPMIWETMRRFQLDTVWINWGIDALSSIGLDTVTLLEFISRSPLFDDESAKFIEKGIQQYFESNYLESSHILVPQIERALRYCLKILGLSPVKGFGSGRGINQFKSINDILTDDDVRGLLTPDVCIYLLAALSHPKGLNARNAICHGLWAFDTYNQAINQRILHCLLTLAMIRYADSSGNAEQ